MLSSNSVNFIGYMFPDLLKILENIAPRLGYTVTSCTVTEIPMEITTFMVRNPSLLPYELLGILIAIYGMFTSIRHPNSWGWFYGSLFYCGMCVSAILCHNILEPQSVSWEFARILDLVCTGASASSFWFTRLIVPSYSFPATFLILLAYNLKYSFLTYTLPFLPEATYIGPIVIAVFALGRRLTKIGDSKLGLVLSVLGFGTIATGLLFDKEMCMAGLYYGAVHAMFLGSDFALLGVLLLSQRTRKEKIE